MKFTNLFLILLLTSSQTFAEEADTSFVVSVASYHLDRSKNYNEDNFGLGLEELYPNNVRLGGGWYHDSFGNLQLYFALRKHWKLNSWSSYGANLHLITHTLYHNGEKWLPLIAPSIKLEKDNWGVIFSGLPPISKVEQAFFTMQIFRNF